MSSGSRLGDGEPYSRTGRSSVLPRTFGAWALDLDFLNSRQRLGQTLNLLRFRVRLSEYYNFGRIEPGRHGCFFGLENGHLRPSTIIFSRCAALMKAAPHGARGKSSLTWGAARQNPRFLRKTDSSSDFHYLRPLRRPCWMACGPLTLKNVRGVLGRTRRAGVLAT